MPARAHAAEVAANPRAFLELARVPGTVTAAANVLAGYWVATGGGPLSAPVAATVGASMLLYGGGVALNDWFDRGLDREHRPLRPIPSGRVTERAALLFGASLVAGGVALAALGGLVTLAVAAGIGVLILTYDAYAKSFSVLGPLNMGLLRGFNFLLGVALVPEALPLLAPVALAYVAFVAAITLAGRGEEGGARRVETFSALALLAAATVWVALTVLPYAGALEAAPFLLAFLALTAPRFWALHQAPKPSRAHAAVKGGVMALVLLDATLVAAAAGWPFGLAVATLLLPALALAKAIPVS